MLLLAALKGFKSEIDWCSSTSPAARARSWSAATDILPPARAFAKKLLIWESRKSREFPWVALLWFIIQCNSFDST
jgi:hypothetical protein